MVKCFVCDEGATRNYFNPQERILPIRSIEGNLQFFIFQPDEHIFVATIEPANMLSCKLDSLQVYTCSILDSFNFCFIFVDDAH